MQSLTAREVQVAFLVVPGLTNQEVVQRLNLPVGKITYHLHRIYEKFDVPNRTALTARIVGGT